MLLKLVMDIKHKDSGNENSGSVENLQLLL